MGDTPRRAIDNVPGCTMPSGQCVFIHVDTVMALITSFHKISQLRRLDDLSTHKETKDDNFLGHMWTQNLGMGLEYSMITMCLALTLKKPFHMAKSQRYQPHVHFAFPDAPCGFLN